VSDSEQRETGGVEGVAPAAPIDALVAQADLSAPAEAVLPPELAANSVGEYFAAWGRRLRNGESGALPIVAGLIIIVIFFQVQQHLFDSSGNLVNLLIQSSIYIMFGAAELFALLLSEIDLSIGFAAAVAAMIVAEVNSPPVNLPWTVAILAGLGFVAAFGFIQGQLITRLNLPSFVVTLGGLLFLEGVLLELADIDPTALGGVMSLPGTNPVYKLASAEMSVTLGWIVLVVGIAAYAGFAVLASAKKRKAGLTAPPLGVTLLTIGIVAIGGLILVLICNGNGTTPGIPWVVPFVLVILFGWTVMLGRTKLGRYIYAIGANPEAARRAGINVGLIRTIGFTLCGLGAGFAGLVYMSYLGSISTGIDGGNYTLFAVAAGVIGGGSLFGGRGKPLNALLGGLVIGVVFNGLGLMGVSAAVQEMVTAGVLIAAVTLDALVRRRSSTPR
jgi:D-xylose transport system permease protein